jgi:hypothetical protein
MIVTAAEVLFRLQQYQSATMKNAHCCLRCIADSCLWKQRSEIQDFLKIFLIPARIPHKKSGLEKFLLGTLSNHH